MIDYLWIIAATIFIVALTTQHVVETRRYRQHLNKKNEQKIFHMRMQLSDRLKMDLGS